MTNFKIIAVATALATALPGIAYAAQNAYSITPYVTTGIKGAGVTRGAINMAENMDRDRVAARYDSNEYMPPNRNDARTDNDTPRYSNPKKNYHKGYKR